MARKLCGKTVARLILEQVRIDFQRVRGDNPRFTPRLDIIQANDRPDTKIYVAKKLEAMQKLGFAVHVHPFGQEEGSRLCDKVVELNGNSDCHGIIVQSPVELVKADRHMIPTLPGLVDPLKDVDGLHPGNLGRLASRDGVPEFYPCTPLGILRLLQHFEIPLGGKRVAVLGRSEIVGMPLSLMLTREGATVTLCHSRTLDIPRILYECDMVVAAIGHPSFIRKEWIRPGAIIVDVGINRVDDGAGGMRLVGDVHSGAYKVAEAYTPVPGGVGPMTVALLVSNVFAAALKHHGYRL